MTVYLIHFEEPLAHARHYIGFTDLEVGLRLKRHREGRGSSLLKACNEKGIDYSIVRVWPGETRDFERKLKKRKKSSMFCPVCNEKMRDHLYKGECSE